jgi:hypothetical protein
MSALGVVTFHRKRDRDKGADLRQNLRSLQRCQKILADSGSLCIFPEGISHSDSSLREFKTGAARIALDHVIKKGNPGRLKIVPVGLLYTEKDRFRSSVWVRFGIPIDAGDWRRDHPAGGPAELTDEIRRSVASLTLNYPSRRVSTILSWAGEIAATNGQMPRPLGAAPQPVASWFRLMSRLRTGYDELSKTQPEAVAELARRIRRYRVELKRRGIAPHEVYLPLHPGRAFLFLIRELELALVGAPLAAFGAANHIVPYHMVKWLAKKLSTDKDHWATNVVYPSLLVFPICYFLQLTAAWCLLPPWWAAMYSVLLPFTGYYALLYGDRWTQTWQRTMTFFRFLWRRPDQQRLVSDGRAILTQMRDLAASVESASK